MTFNSPVLYALPTELIGHVEFSVLAVVRLLLLCHLLLIAGTPERSELVISIKQELTCYLE